MIKWFSLLHNEGNIKQGWTNLAWGSFLEESEVEILANLALGGIKKRLFDWFSSDNVFIEPAAAAESKVCTSQTKFPHDSSTSHLFPLYVYKCIENPIYSHFGSGVTWLPGGFKWNFHAACRRSDVELSAFTVLSYCCTWFLSSVLCSFCLKCCFSYMLFKQLPGNDSNGGKKIVLFI